MEEHFVSVLSFPTVQEGERLQTVAGSQVGRSEAERGASRKFACL